VASPALSTTATDVVIEELVLVCEGLDFTSL
jgi:hypothetical protein